MELCPRGGNHDINVPESDLARPVFTRLCGFFFPKDDNTKMSDVSITIDVNHVAFSLLFSTKFGHSCESCGKLVSQGAFGS